MAGSRERGCAVGDAIGGFDEEPRNGARFVVAALTCGALNAFVLASPLAWAAHADGRLWCCSALFLAGATLFYCVELLPTLRNDRPQPLPKPGDRAALRAALCGSVLVFATLAVGMVERSQQAINRMGGLEAVGLVVMVSGCAVRYCAIRGLGRRFRTETTVPVDFQLETNGIYGVVRHPSEVGLFLVLIGTAVLLNSFGAALLALVQLPMIAWRVRLENRSFEQALGDRFAVYRRQVAGFIPFLF